MTTTTTVTIYCVHRTDVLRIYARCSGVCGGAGDRTQACSRLVCACECPRARGCCCFRASLFYFCEMIVLFSCANISAVGISCACAIFFFTSTLFRPLSFHLQCVNSEFMLAKNKERESERKKEQKVKKFVHDLCAEHFFFAVVLHCFNGCFVFPCDCG